jgi:hypothetical protein
MNLQKTFDGSPLDFLHSLETVTSNPIFRGGRAVIDPQVRFRTEGGAGDPQLRLPCNPLAIAGLSNLRVRSWNIAKSQK